MLVPSPVRRERVRVRDICAARLPCGAAHSLGVKLYSRGISVLLRESGTKTPEGITARTRSLLSSGAVWDEATELLFYSYPIVDIKDVSRVFVLYHLRNSARI